MDRAPRGAFFAALVPRLVRALVCVLVLGVPVFLLAVAVRLEVTPILRTDQAVIGWATATTRGLGLAPGLILLQAVSHPAVVYPLATLVALWVGVVKRLWGRALWGFATMMVAWVVGELLKLVVQRARPMLDVPLSLPPGYSFPSGHALNITVAAGVVLVLMWPLWSGAARTAAVTVAAVVVVLVGLDRIFLGVHFPSDVVAGYVLGCCITFSSWIGFGAPTREISSSASSSPP